MLPTTHLSFHVKVPPEAELQTVQNCACHPASQTMPPADTPLSLRASALWGVHRRGQQAPEVAQPHRRQSVAKPMDCVHATFRVSSSLMFPGIQSLAGQVPQGGQQGPAE